MADHEALITERVDLPTFFRGVVQRFLQENVGLVVPGESTYHSFDTLHLIDPESEYHYVYDAKDSDDRRQRGIYIKRPYLVPVIMGSRWRASKPARGESRHYFQKGFGRVTRLDIVGKKPHRIVLPEVITPESDPEEQESLLLLMNDVDRLKEYRAVKPVSNIMARFVFPED